MESIIAPIGAHLRVHEVLVNRREIGGENFIQQLENPLLSFHRHPPVSGRGVV
jgi:hypothetical protein